MYQPQLFATVYRCVIAKTALLNSLHPLAKEQALEVKKMFMNTVILEFMILNMADRNAILRQIQGMRDVGIKSVTYYTGVTKCETLSLTEAEIKILKL